MRREGEGESGGGESGKVVLDQVRGKGVLLGQVRENRKDRVVVGKARRWC